MLACLLRYFLICRDICHVIYVFLENLLFTGHSYWNPWSIERSHRSRHLLSQGGFFRGGLSFCFLLTIVRAPLWVLCHSVLAWTYYRYKDANKWKSVLLFFLYKMLSFGILDIFGDSCRIEHLFAFSYIFAI